jgi:cell shape-determining protein MreC
VFTPDTILAFIVGLVAAPFAAAITFATTRQKSRADVHASVVTSAHSAVDTITDVLEQVRQELSEARTSLDDAKREIEELRKDNASLRQSLALLNVRINELSKIESTQKSGDA